MKKRMFFLLVTINNVIHPSYALDQRSIKVIERTAVPVIKVSTKDSRSRVVQLDLSFDAKEHHGLEALNMIRHILEVCVNIPFLARCIVEDGHNLTLPCQLNNCTAIAYGPTSRLGVKAIPA